MYGKWVMQGIKPTFHNFLKNNSEKKPGHLSLWIHSCLLNKSQDSASPKRLQSLTLKLETARLKTSDTGINPHCAAGTAKPAPTVLALSLKGLQSQWQNNGNIREIPLMKQEGKENIKTCLYTKISCQGKAKFTFINMISGKGLAFHQKK